MKLSKIVFPVAGLGSRFLPATKATPKEMLPIVDKPLIQYAVEEAIDAGFTELIFVNAKSKVSIKEHFDRNLNLDISNLTKEKKELLNQTNQIIPNNASCSFIIQDEPLGLGHAILLAKSVIKKDPFAVILADDLIDSQKGVLKQMVEEYKDTSSSIVSVQKIDKSNSIHYGMVSIRDDNLKSMQLENIIEKPLPEDSPSNLGVVGTSFGTGNEIQLTDAIKSMLSSYPVFAYEFEGIRYDCGDKLGFIKANIEYALKSGIFGDELKEYLKTRLL